MGIETDGFIIDLPAGGVSLGGKRFGNNEPITSTDPDIDRIWASETIGLATAQINFRELICN